ncbi:MAG: hypothetical protein AB8F95_01385 [Bacteroidia bacterium]
MKLQPLVIAAILIQVLFTGCMSMRTIKPSGLKGISLGDPMPELNVTRMLGHPAHDSIIEEGEYSWRAMIIEHPSGDILVESDYFDQNKINRIQIKARDLRYQKHITVGSTVDALSSLSQRWFITHLPDYDRVDLTIEGLHFLIDDTFLETKSEEAIQKDDIPKDAQILAIILM